jgi:hypothetical protein
MKADRKISLFDPNQIALNEETDQGGGKRRACCLIAEKEPLQQPTKSRLGSWLQQITSGMAPQ